MSQKQNQINIELSDEISKGKYANLAMIAHSSSEFVIDFIQLMPGVPKAKVNSRIIITPEHAKKFSVALNDNSGIINAALEGMCAIYKNGYEYKKCGVILNDLVQANEVQQSLFYDRRDKDERISASIDQINQAFGSDTIRYAVQGENKSWSIKREKLSPAYTTNWNEFLTLKV